MNKPRSFHNAFLDKTLHLVYPRCGLYTKFYIRGEDLISDWVYARIDTRIMLVIFSILNSLESRMNR